MRRRLSQHLRCPECRLHVPLCLCRLLPSIATRTHVVLVLHALELQRPSNTGRLAVRCLPNSRIVLRGAHPPPLPTPENPKPETVTWPEGTDPVLLFPHAEAQPLADVAARAPRPLTLIVPDGTWTQAIRMRKRTPGLAGVPAVRLPDDLVSAYRLRHDERPAHVSTLEAIAHALGILEGAAARERLLYIERVMVERTLWMQGRLAADQVTGGIPAGVHFNGLAVPAPES